MAKIQKLSDIQQEISFTEFDFYHRYEESFKSSELGRIKSLLPLGEMAISFGLVEENPKNLRTQRGRKPFFTPEGKVALAFLKMHTGPSAPKLMEALNGNIHYQIFCGIRICPESQLTNYKLIDNILLELSKKLKIQEQQKILADAWKPYMKNLDTVYTDASCYESLMRFPTDVKLLMECVERAHKMMCSISVRLGERRMRTKYNDIEKANLAYRKQRKHTHKQTRKMIMRLLSLLEKILCEIRRQMRVHPNEELLNDKHLDMLEIITRVYRQQKNHFNSGDSCESIPNRIVSVSKPYVFVEERNGTWNTPYLFNGKELDEETGFYYYGARYLNPTSAVWLSVDPIFHAGSSPYAYCLGNPVKLIDTDGRVETYFDENGNQIGTGLNDADNSKFVIKEKFDKKILKKAKGRADLSTMKSAYKLPSDAVLTEALDVLDRTIQNGGTREESSIVRKNGDVLRGESGNDVTAESSIATASLPNYDYPTSEVEATIHSHVLVTFNLNDEFAVKWSDANSVGPKDSETFSQYDCNIIVGKKGGLYKEINPNKSPSFERYIDNRPIGIGIFGRFTKAGDKSNVWLNYNAVEKIIKSSEK